MSGSKVGVTIEFKGDNSRLGSALGQSERQIHAFGNTIRNTFSQANRYLDAATQHFGFMGTAITAFTSGAILKKLFSVADYMPLDNAMLMMQARLHLTVRETAELRKNLAGLAGKEGVDIKTVFSKGGGLAGAFGQEGALKILTASARAARSLNADYAETTDAIAQMMKLFGKSADDSEEIADRLVAARVKDMASLDLFMERYMVRGGGSGKDLEDMLGLKGGLARAGFTSPRMVMQIAQALNAIEMKPSALKKGGIDLYRIDPETKEKVKKNTIEIMEEMRSNIERDRKKGLTDEAIKADMNKAFGGEVAGAIFMFVKSLDKVKQGYEAQRNAAKAASEMGAAGAQTWEYHLGRVSETLAGIKTDFSQIYDLAKRPVAWLGDHSSVTKALGYGAGSLALLTGGGLFYGTLRRFIGSLGGTAAGIAEGKLIQGTTGVQPVFVAGGRLDSVTALPSVTSSISSLGSILPLAIGAAIVAAFFNHASKPEVKEESETRAVQAGIADARLQRLSDKFLPTTPEGIARRKEELKNEVTINMRVDMETGRSFVYTDDMNTTVTLNRGK